MIINKFYYNDNGINDVRMKVNVVIKFDRIIAGSCDVRSILPIWSRQPRGRCRWVGACSRWRILLGSGLSAFILSPCRLGTASGLLRIFSWKKESMMGIWIVRKSRGGCLRWAWLRMTFGLFWGWSKRAIFRQWESPSIANSAVNFWRPSHSRFLGHCLPFLQG